jgi:LL-diaminopimelate aminotransferase
MIRINEDYLKLKESYLFSDIRKRTDTFQAAHPEIKIIKLGIGDVTHSLPKACIAAFHRAVDEMADDATFRGYGPEQGYDFLRNKIAETDFQSRNADIAFDEIFISDGSKCDTGNIQEIFSKDNKIAIPDPVYPVYLDTNIMAGRSGDTVDGRYENIVYMDGTKENGFIPDFPKVPVDLIYLCFPNNPTGATITRSQLQSWVDFARDQKALILYDAAYEAFIQDETLPRSIYEVDGAKEVAIEFRSFSKSAGFTGTRCAFTVVPKSCMAFTKEGTPHSLHPLWHRRQSTKFNSVSYPVQRAAEAVYSLEGQTESRNLVRGYLKNSAFIRKKITDLGYDCIGGENSPYIWIDCGMDSWTFFDLLLEKAGVVCTPGSGFGKCGEGFIRLSAFNSFEIVKEAMERIQDVIGTR